MLSLASENGPSTTTADPSSPVLTDVAVSGGVSSAPWLTMTEPYFSNHENIAV
jgi:hypothetical protein